MLEIYFRTLDEDVELGARATHCAHNISKNLYHLPTYACIDRWVRYDVRNSSTQTGVGPLGSGSWAPVALLAISLRGTCPPVTTSSSLLLKPQQEIPVSQFYVPVPQPPPS